MFKTRGIFILLALLAATLPPALAHADTPSPGDIPDNQAFVRFSTASYSLVTPEGWARRMSGRHVTFADKYNSIEIEIGAAVKRPTVGSVTATEISLLRTHIAGFRSPTVTSLVRPAGRVVLVRYEARSRRDSVTGRTVVDDVERYEFWKSGRLAVVTLAAPHGSDNVDPWRTVTQSFRWR